MAENICLAAGTSAANSTDIAVTTGPVSVYLFGAVSGAQLEVQRKANGTWQTHVQGGRAVYLTGSNRSEVIIGPGTYRVVRTATPDAVGVAYDNGT